MILVGSRTEIMIALRLLCVVAALLIDTALPFGGAFGFCFDDSMPVLHNGRPRAAHVRVPGQANRSLKFAKLRPTIQTPAIRSHTSAQVFVKRTILQLRNPSSARSAEAPADDH
jgi:hypothetical protein